MTGLERSYALILGLLLLTVPLVGCLDGAQDGTDGDAPDGDDGTDGDGEAPDDGEEEEDEEDSPTDDVQDEIDDTLAGDDVDVRVKQDSGNTVYWVLPGQRELDPKIFGTPEDPKFPGDWAREQAQGPIADLLDELPFPVGVPEEGRVVENGTYKTKAPTLFSDEAVPGVAGSFDVTYQDRQPWDTGAPGNTSDTVQLSTTFEDPQGNEYSLEVDHVVQPPMPGYRTGGGVIVNDWHHGPTGTGSPLMPMSYTYGAFWALAHLDVDGERVQENMLTHFMTTETVRDSDYEIVFDADLPLAPENTPTGQQHHTHGVVFPIQGTPEGPVFQPVNTSMELPNGETQPFIHVMFEEDEIVEGPFTDEEASGQEVAAEQSEGTYYWVLPGQRELDPRVFGTAEDPKFPGDWAREQAQGPIADLLDELPFPVGVPEEGRVVEEDTYKTQAPTLFSDNAQPISEGENSFSVTYQDNQPWDTGAPGDTSDTVELNTTFHDPQGNEYSIEVDHVVQPPMPGYRTGGGVMTNAHHHGTTGTGSPLMPQAYTYGAFWLLGDLHVNGELEQENMLTHFMTTETVRNSDYEIVFDSDLPLTPDNTPTGKIHHTHGVVFPIQGTPEGPIFQPVNTSMELPNGETQPFIHAMWEEETLTAGPHSDWSPESSPVDDPTAGSIASIAEAGSR